MNRINISLVFPLFLLAAPGASPVAGQPDPALARYQSSCGECSIVMTKVATLGSTAEPASPYAGTSLARDSQGRFYAIAERRDMVLVYGANGILLRTLGRRGPGPGEFAVSGIHDLALGRGDTLYVLERGNYLSVFSPSLVFVRKKRVPGPVAGSVILEDGRVVLNTRIPQPAHVGYPFHLVDSDGNLVRPLGPESALLPNQIEDTPAPLIASPGGSSVWRVSSNYRIEEWRLGGERGVTLEFTDIPWLPKRPPPAPKFRNQRASGSQTSASLRGSIMAMNARADSLRNTPGAIPLPSAGVRLARIDRAGLVWIHGTYPIPSENRVERVLEVIDPRSRQLLVSQRQNLGSWVHFIGSSDYAYAMELDADGAATVNVWRVELRR